jgi:hypothetical protein
MGAMLHACVSMLGITVFTEDREGRKEVPLPAHSAADDTFIEQEDAEQTEELLC